MLPNEGLMGFDRLGLNEKTPMGHCKGVVHTTEKRVFKKVCSEKHDELTISKVEVISKDESKTVNNTSAVRIRSETSPCKKEK